MDTWTAEKLRSYQLQKIKRMLRHAYDNLPFYRRRLQKAHIEPESVRDLSDFPRVPSFTKAEVLQEIREKKSFATGMETLDRSLPAVLCMTSGTLGTSFLYHTKKWRSIRGDSLARAYWWAGLRPGMRVLTAAPAWHSLAVQETRVLERLGATCLIPWGTFLPTFSANFLVVLQDMRPQFVSMFLPMLYAILAECRRRGASPRAVFDSVEYLLLGGAPMTPRSREHLMRELDIQNIYEGLGNPEGLTAMECSFHCGHHVFLDCCYVEIMDPKTGAILPPGTRGSVVLTSLIPHGSVYIRYDSEDLGEMLPNACVCGRTWPLIEVYDRRVNIVQVAGKEIVPYDVRLCLDELPELVGLPFALIRGKTPSNVLKLALQKPVAGDPVLLGARLRALITERLQLDARPQWTEELPERWKGVTVIEENDWGMPVV
jgi:phenylacetate-CoA ligase